jgi:hypothetical protein
MLKACFLVIVKSIDLVADRVIKDANGKRSDGHQRQRQNIKDRRSSKDSVSCD